MLLRSKKVNVAVKDFATGENKMDRRVEKEILVKKNREGRTIFQVVKYDPWDEAVWQLAESWKSFDNVVDAVKYYSAL